MSKSKTSSASPVSRISFVGRSSGAVKNLGGFRKQHHTLPDAVNAATSAFLAKLCASELADEGEAMFQRVRAALGYKRAELALDVASPHAVLTAKDFVFEIAYALEERAPAEFVVTRTLHDVKSQEMLERTELDELFADAFDGIVFGLGKGVSVEGVIDAVEELPGGAALTVTYPSNCAHCVLRVEGVAAEVICDGTTLEMRFPKNGSPRELAREFLTVRAAFALTKKRALAGLI
ncbi:MAG: hypothetical protein KF715_13155 [Candidatus Didemnitutus sp.]|nr:hypothetical protein [Candidatus Didemnitutus sp.]